MTRGRSQRGQKGMGALVRTPIRTLDAKGGPWITEPDFRGA